MKVTILSKNKTIFDGYAQTVTSFNAVGPFDILKGHANFICLINSAVILNKAQKDEQMIDIKKGVLRVSKDKVEVFA